MNSQKIQRLDCFRLFQTSFRYTCNNNQLFWRLPCDDLSMTSTVTLWCKLETNEHCLIVLKYVIWYKRGQYELYQVFLLSNLFLYFLKYYLKSIHTTQCIKILEWTFSFETRPQSKSVAMRNSFYKFTKKCNWSTDSQTDKQKDTFSSGSLPQ